MKKILLATTLLAASTGFAAAEVTLSGDARMGIVKGFDQLDGFGTPANPAGIDESELSFTSRARVKFTLSGETDGGLAFGGSFRAHDAGGANGGTAGSVFISGAFGKLTMGDVDGAANAAVGHVSGVGLTGLSDKNESTFLANGGSNFDDDVVGSTAEIRDTLDPSALYEYSTGDLTIYASVTNPGRSGTSDAYSLGAKYALGDYTVALAYEDLQGSNDAGALANDIQHLILGASATFGAVTVKANYGQADGTLNGVALDDDQMAVSVDYKMDALTVTAFYNDNFGSEAYGLGASYDLGGGASVVGGYVRDESSDEDAYDLGVSMSF